MTLTDNTTRIADDSRKIDRVDSPAGDDRAATRDAAGSVPVGTIVLFLLGCGVLVAAAMTVSNLGSWGAQVGEVWVFLGFFVVMSIGGRWFWAGVDAIITALRSGKDG
ncbi:hypothetical protein nbrc107696_19530 [Gordonia spumicola]|uniref:Uncharacterized protein n=1 Tax=Gordonia spumicola TaxID=589161 RepID=A0A7I9V875_9ACTN|nr:hypothetical protein nbrc107696_19530 [Gordonia spumicola]